MDTLRTESKTFRLEEIIAFEFILATGIRLEDLINLNYNDIHLDSMHAYINNSITGAHEGHVNLSIHLSILLKMLWSINVSRPIFIDPMGKRLTPMDIDKFIKQLGKLLGFDSLNSNHLRSTFIINECPHCLRR